MWRKRLFDQISAALDSGSGTPSKRPCLSATALEAFACPQCESPLAPCDVPCGVVCSQCKLHIALDRNDLSPPMMQAMMTTAKEQHCHDGWAPSGLVASTSFPGQPDLVFLTWTCHMCGMVEILL